MNEKNIAKTLKTVKLVQLITALCLDISFFLLFFLNKSLRHTVFANSTLTVICAAVWLTMLCFFIFIVIDLVLCSKLTVKSHELNKLAYLDNLTSIPNRHSLDLLFNQYSTPKSLENVCCCMLGIKNISYINENQGRETGDRLLQDFSLLLEEIGDSYGFVARNSGNEFVLLMDDCSESKFDFFYHSFTTRIAAYNAVNSETPIEFQIAHIINKTERIQRLDQLFAATSSKLYTI